MENEVAAFLDQQQRSLATALTSEDLQHRIDSIIQSLLGTSQSNSQSKHTAPSQISQSNLTSPSQSFSQITPLIILPQKSTHTHRYGLLLILTHTTHATRYVPVKSPSQISPRPVKSHLAQSNHTAHHINTYHPCHFF